MPPSSANAAGIGMPIASARTPDPVIERTELRGPSREAHSRDVIDALPTALRTAPPSSSSTSPTRAATPGGTRTPSAMWMKHAFGLDVLSCPRCRTRMDVVAVVQDAIEVRRDLSNAGIALRDADSARRRRDTPTRAWDPMPFDDAFVEHAGRDPCRDDLPPDDWTA